MIYLWVLLLLFSCSTATYQHAAVHFEHGNLDEAERDLAEVDRAYTKNRESALLLLSRAMVYFQNGKMEESVKDFQAALDAIDYYKQTSVAEVMGQTLIQDGVGAYVPPLFEEGLARFYLALAFLHLGDEDNAAATLYYLENHEGQNPLTTYLLGTLLMRRGDDSNARVLFNRLGMDLPQGNILVIHHRGLVPHKISKIAPTSIVCAAVLETILGIEDVRPALSTLMGVPVPELVGIREVSHLGLPQKPVLSYDVALAAKAALEKEMPWIATRAAARLLLRRGVVASAKEDVQPLMDIAMLISNAATQADTRSWRMLPAQIDLYHLNKEKPGIIEIFQTRKNDEKIYSNCSINHIGQLRP